TTLKHVATETHLKYPDLDVESLTSLMAAFSSEDDRAVVAAMDLVADQHDVRAIPVVMLFHPSPAVVLRALELFEEHRREGFGWALDRLRRDSHDSQIRAAALRASASQQKGDSVLRCALDDPDE